MQLRRRVGTGVPNIIKYKKDGEELSHNVYRKFGDTSYVKFYGLELVAGRNVLPSDTVKEFVINETYSRILGFEAPQEVLGERIYYNDEKAVPIVGVVKDFHLKSMHNPIEPVVIAGESENSYCFGLKLAYRGTACRGRRSGHRQSEGSVGKGIP